MKNVALTTVEVAEVINASLDGLFLSSSSLHIQRKRGLIVPTSNKYKFGVRLYSYSDILKLLACIMLKKLGINMRLSKDFEVDKQGEIYFFKDGLNLVYKIPDDLKNTVDSHIEKVRNG